MYFFKPYYLDGQHLCERLKKIFAVFYLVNIISFTCKMVFNANEKISFNNNLYIRTHTHIHTQYNAHNTTQKQGNLIP